MIYILLICLKTSNKNYLKSLDCFVENCLSVSKISKINQISNDDLESRLKYYFKDNINSHKVWNSDYNKFTRQFEGVESNPPVVTFSYRFLNTIRQLTITSFKWSEIIGENVLKHNPIPEINWLYS